MSVRIGTPTASFTRLRTLTPSPRPGPRNDASEVRFALSYEALKMYGTPHRAAMALIARARSMAWLSLSMTQGPAMRTSGLPPPMVIGPTVTDGTVRSYLMDRERGGTERRLASRARGPGASNHALTLAVSPAGVPSCLVR